MLSDKVKEINVSIAEGNFDAEAVLMDWEDVDKSLLAFDQCIEVGEIALDWEEDDISDEVSLLASEKASGFRELVRAYNITPLKSKSRPEIWEKIRATPKTDLERQWLGIRRTSRHRL